MSDRRYLSITGWVVLAVAIFTAALFVAFLIPADAAPTPVQYPLIVSRVIDGDSFKFDNPDFPGFIRPWEVRVSGIDTPEHVKPPAKKMCEVRMGLRATEVAKTLLHVGDTVTVTWDGKTHEKYGRLIGTVTLPDGSDYGTRMIAAGAARAYDGGTKRPWC